MPGFFEFGGDAFGATGSGAILYAADNIALSGVAEHWRVLLAADAFAMGDDASSQTIIHAIDSIVAAATARSIGAMTLSAEDAFALQDVVSIVIRFIASDAFEVADNAASIKRQIVTAVDTLLAAGVATSRLGAIQRVAEALAIHDVAAKVFAMPPALSEASFGDEVVNHANMYHRIVESFAVDDLAVNTLRGVAIVHDGFALGDAAGSKAAFFNACADGFVLNIAVQLLDGEYVAWVVNTESKAVSRYLNFGFNSFAEHGQTGKYFGAKSDGVYLLEGSNDDGESIDALVRSGLSDFGQSAMKGFPLGYLSLSNDGQLLLRVIVTSTEDGEKECYWYRLEERPAANVRETRVKVGGGLESVWWQWELVNVDGADFDVASMRWLPVALSPRV